jgi:[ribosomal protein S5]-alanine N-acetyltransferase
MEVPRLTSEHIVLRPITENDIPALFELFSSEAVMRFMDVSGFKEIEQAKNLLAFFKERQEQGKGMRWAVSLPAKQEMIGTCGFHHMDNPHFKLEIGYDLLPAYWGRGIMRHAIRRMIQYAFHDKPTNRIEAFVHPDNHRSYRLLESLGFHREGLQRQAFFSRGHFVDSYLYSLLQGDRQM